MRYYEIHEKILSETHVLIAGTPGSGKSVLLNGLIYSALAFTPDHYKLVLIDPKKVELSKYNLAPHCIAYADDPESINQVLKSTCQLMDTRYKELQQRRLDKLTGDHIWVLIDEMVDLSAKLERDKTTREIKKEIEQSLIRLLSLGRAAGIHVIACTQRPTSDVITGVIKANVTSMIAMRTRSAQDSRNILDEPGAERLPTHGKAIYYSPSVTRSVIIDVPFIPLPDLIQRADSWSGTPQAFNLPTGPPKIKPGPVKLPRIRKIIDEFFKTIWSL